MGNKKITQLYTYYKQETIYKWKKWKTNLF